MRRQLAGILAACTCIGLCAGSLESSRAEAKVEKLEGAQKSVTEQLSDATVYADAQRRKTLLEEFESNKRDLDKLTSQWESLTLEIEEKEAAL